MPDPNPSVPTGLRLTGKGMEVIREPAPSAPAATDGRALRCENGGATAPAAPPPDSARPKSQRTRDYWIALLAGNLVFAGVMALVPLNLVVLIFGFAGMVVYSVGITWIMWFVMSDY